MNDCKPILELLPWYAIGNLASEDAAAVAEHLRGCDVCRIELAEVLRLWHGLSGDVGVTEPIRDRVWRRVTVQAGIRDIAQIDLGSLAIGLRLGLSARRSAPVRASLRVMGRQVRIVGPKGRGMPDKPKEAS